MAKPTDLPAIFFNAEDIEAKPMTPQEQIEMERMKARLAELEAMKRKPVSPAMPFGGMLSLAASVMSLVPRWLVIAAGIVAVTWAGFEMYINAQILIANKDKATAESCLARSTALGNLESGDTLLHLPNQGQEKLIPEREKWNEDCGQYRARITAVVQPTPLTNSSTKHSSTYFVDQLAAAHPNSLKSEIYQQAWKECVAAQGEDYCKLIDITKRLREALSPKIADAEVEVQAKAACERKYGAPACL